MSNTEGAFGVHACGFHSLFLSELFYHIGCGVELAQYGEACYLRGNRPPVAATWAHQCPGFTVRLWKLLPARGLENAECSVSLVAPSILDGLLGSCCESDALVGCCCRQSLLGLAAWAEYQGFLPCADGGHGDQARRDWEVAGGSYSRTRTQAQSRP